MKKLVAFFGLLVVASAIMYIVNPYGTASLDPRARIWGITVYQNPSRSMTPTIAAGGLLLVTTFTYANSTPESGELVVYKPPHLDTPFIGRVMARGGDKISFKNSIATVNGKLQQEDYILKTEAPCYVQDYPEVSVPDGMLFLVGDNRCNSRDSRSFGFVEQENLIGKVSYIFR